ncbi:MAG: hypothetical protein ACXWLM_09345, partial [Myxococcales bacterium]
GAALQAALKSVKADGKIALSEAAQADVVALLPPARKGEECGEPAKVAAEADALKDRGDGAIVVAEVTTCKGGRVFALSTGQPPRVARLLDSQSEEVRAVKALSLGGGKRDSDLGVEVLTAATTSELLLFTHSESGFGYKLAGALKDFNALRECATGGEDSAGWVSWVKPEQDHLAVLRVDGTCSGGAWQASCHLFRFDQGELARSGTCNLPPRFDAKSLKASGWK